MARDPENDNALPPELAEIINVNLKSRTACERERAVRKLGKKDNRGYKEVLTSYVHFCATGRRFAADFDTAPLTSDAHLCPPARVEQPDTAESGYRQVRAQGSCHCTRHP